MRPLMLGGRALGAPPGFPPMDAAALRLQQQMALQQQARRPAPHAAARRRSTPAAVASALLPARADRGADWQAKYLFGNMYSMSRPHA